MAEHAALGASKAHRWMECPGSVRLSEQVPEREPTEYMLQGTAAHHVAETCLKTGDPADSLIDFEYKSDGTAIPITPEITSSVQLYLDCVREEAGDRPIGIEVTFDLDDLDPPAPMFGTADAVVWDEEEKHLKVFDYKHGKGYVVEVEDNPQLLYYALGAVLELEKKPEEVTVTIVQPRADHPDGPVRSHTYSWDELVEFKERLMRAAHEAAQLDAPIGPVGDHCKFCPAKAICPAQQEKALAVTRQEFAAPVDEQTMRPPETLTKEELARALEWAPIIEDWFREIRRHAQRDMEQGEEYEGFKLVKKRARRYWKDEEDARTWMQEHGISPDRKKTRSPYQAEQAVKTKDVEVPEELWEKKSSGLKLVREDNPRPAVTPADLAGEEFKKLQEGDT